jgi:putative transcriptional regulator
MIGSKNYKSNIKAAIHEMASDLYEAGLIDKQTMRHFDDSCLTPIHRFTAKQIRDLRKREAVSQTVLGYYLNVPKDLISQWERAKKHPSGPSLKLLALVEKKGLAAIA